MGEETTRLEDEIRQERAGLADSFDALESKISRASNWRYQFAKRPLAGIAVAFVGGVALARAVTNSQRNGRPGEQAELKDVGSGSRNRMTSGPSIVSSSLSALKFALAQGVRMYLEQLMARGRSNLQPGQPYREPKWRAGGVTPDT